MSAMMAPLLVGVVGVAAFAPLARRRGDQDNVPRAELQGTLPADSVRGRAARAGQHVGGGGVTQAEDAVDVGGDGAVPLRGSHLRDRGGRGRPDAMVRDRMSRSPKAARVRATRASPSSGVASSCCMATQTVGPPSSEARVLACSAAR